MSAEQIAVRLPPGQLDELDDLVARGTYPSRAAAVRAGIAVIVELDRRRRADREIIDGYRRSPPSEAETAAAIASLRDAIAEEPEPWSTADAATSGPKPSPARLVPLRVDLSGP